MRQGFQELLEALIDAYFKVIEAHNEDRNPETQAAKYNAFRVILDAVKEEYESGPVVREGHLVWDEERMREIAQEVYRSEPQYAIDWPKSFEFIADCPTCKGNGTINANVNIEGLSRAALVTCQICGGKGTLTMRASGKTKHVKIVKGEIVKGEIDA